MIARAARLAVAGGAFALLLIAIMSMRSAWGKRGEAAEGNAAPREPATMVDVAQLVAMLDAPAARVNEVVGALEDAVHAGAAMAWKRDAFDGFVVRLRARAGDRPLRANVEHIVAQAYTDQGRVDLARRELGAFVRTMDSHDFWLGQRLRCRAFLADLCRVQGDANEAIRTLMPARDVEQSIEPAPGESEGQHRTRLLGLGEVHGVWSEILRGHGRFHAASDHLLRSEQMAQALGDGGLLDNCIERDVEILLATSGAAKAKRKLRARLDELAQVPTAERDDEWRLRGTEMTLLVAVAELARDHRSETRDMLTALAQQPLAPQHQAEVHVRLLDLAITEGDFAAAEQHLERCRGLAHIAQTGTAVRVAALAALLARLSPCAAAERRRRGEALEDLFGAQVDEWRRLPPDAGGFGFLQPPARRLLLSELIHLRLTRAGAAAAEAALMCLLETQACSVLARRRNATAGDLEAIRQHVLQPDGGVLIYLPARPQSHVFAITHARVQHWLLAAENDLQHACRPLTNRLVGLTAVTDEAAAAHGIALRRDLDAARAALLPAALADQVRTWKCLSVVGADLMRDLPFEVLPSTDAADAPLLGEIVPVDQLPSLPWAIACARDLVQAPRSPPSLTLFACIAPRAAASEVQSLTLTEGDLTFLQHVESKRACIGARATVQAAADAEPTAITHFLAHEDSRDDELLTGLSLYDGSLWHESFAKRPRRGGLGVLSVCGAGATERRLGEGISLTSLGGALLAAGAQAVMQSRDKVLLVEHLALLDPFYRELMRQASPAAALQRARSALAGGSSLVARVRRGQFQVIGLGHRPL